MLKGYDLSLLWGIPFAGVLLSIALLPLMVPAFWHRHYGKVMLLWTLGLLIPMVGVYGISLTLHEFLHTMFMEYIPFIVLIGALYIITGGILLRAEWLGSPLSNTLVLISGTLAASWIGTTGAAMLLIRPLIRANSWREHNVHIKIFFVFLVANIGGALTPLGDPPLFVGFLYGVGFFWTTQNLLLPLIAIVIPMLIIFYFLDHWFYHKEEETAPVRVTHVNRLSFEGWFNFILLGGVILSVLLSGLWKSSLEFSIGGISIPLMDLLRCVFIVLLAAVSWFTTSHRIRTDNAYTWDPLLEVVKIFAAIFVTVLPVIAILSKGRDGALGWIIEMVSDKDGVPLSYMYFWVTGILSAFLDNAPTYLVFFHTAGGDAEFLMGDCCGALMAISCGAVFMGALTYIGNAPNFMVRAIVEQQGIKMPSFLGYMAWSCLILIPLFGLLTLLFFL
ncbi:MAG: sodium:proton antiporter [Alphaproteobacteria bacterium]|nr:sodium:proton antiporter [Alphaproteobacteria bacterium]